MEIKNEEHAKKKLQEWQELPLPARKREIRLALERLELSAMYYEQKGNDNAALRANRCASLLTQHLESLE